MRVSALHGCSLGSCPQPPACHHRQAKRRGTSSSCSSPLLHLSPACHRGQRSLLSWGLQRTEKCLLRASLLKTTCQVKPGSPEFHLQGRGRGNWSSLRAEGVTASPGSWQGSRAPTRVLGRCWTGLTPTLFDREAMPGRNNYARSFYCQIERQGNYQATDWCIADQEVCSGCAFFKALK